MSKRRELPQHKPWTGHCPTCGGLNVEVTDLEGDAIESYTCWDCNDAWGVKDNVII